MSLLSPIALETLALAAAVLGGLTVIAYILKMRRRRFEVPFSLLWQRILRERETTSLWKHLRRLLSLLLMLAILALLLFAATEPELGEQDDDASSVVLVVDASASMKTLDSGSDGSKTRLSQARARAHEILSSMGGGDAAMVIKMDGRATPLSRFEPDVASLHRVVDGIRASDTPANLRRALTAAGDALRERKNPMIVVIGDGAYPDEVREDVVWERAAEGDPLSRIDLTGIDTRFVSVGEANQNVGIVAFNVRRYITNKMAYEVFVEIQNFGSEPARRELVLYGGDAPIEVQAIELAPGERRRTIYEDLGGGDGSRLRASLEPPDGAEAPADAFPLDDEAFALLPERKRQRVLLVTEDNLYLEGAMLVYDNIVVDKLVPDDYEQGLADGSLPDYDAVVFDDYTPDETPPSGTHLLYFNPLGDASPFPIRTTIPRPRVTDTADSHPIMRWLVFDDVNFDEASVFRLDREAGEVALVSSVRRPIAAAARDGRRKVAAFGFSLTGTDLMLRVAFPLLLVNTLDWFAGDDADLITTYSTGERVRIPMDGTFSVSEVKVRTPSGGTRRAPLSDGHASFYADEAGVHELTASQGGRPVASVTIAANLSDPRESRIEPATSLTLGGAELREPEGFSASHRRSLWRYLALAALILLGVEWLTYNRRITV